MIRFSGSFCARSYSAMPRNVEIKAKLPNPTKASEVARELSGIDGTFCSHVACTHAQIDVTRVLSFFRRFVGSGRHVL